MLLFATPFCYASGYTLAVANHIIVIQVVIVIIVCIIIGLSVSETSSFDAFLRPWTTTGP